MGVGKDRETERLMDGRIRFSIVLRYSPVFVRRSGHLNHELLLFDYFRRNI